MFGGAWPSRGSGRTNSEGPPGLAGGRKETSDMRHTFLVLAASTFLAVFAGCACKTAAISAVPAPAMPGASPQQAAAAAAGRPGWRRKLSLLHGPRSARFPGNASAEHRSVTIELRRNVRGRDTSRSMTNPKRCKTGICIAYVRVVLQAHKKTAAYTAETCCVICHAFRVAHGNTTTNRPSSKGIRSHDGEQPFSG